MPGYRARAWVPKISTVRTFEGDKIREEMSSKILRLSQSVSISRRALPKVVLPGCKSITPSKCAPEINALNAHSSSTTSPAKNASHPAKKRGGLKSQELSFEGWDKGFSVVSITIFLRVCFFRPFLSFQ